MIRAFSLRDSVGNTYNLNIPDTSFLYEPRGLGYEMDVGYIRIGTSWARNYFRDNQGEISGSVVFPQNQYNGAADFLRFVRGSGALTLVYTTDAGEFLRDVDLVSFDKSEITTGNVLRCPVRLRARGLWYSPYATRVVISAGASGRGTRYSFRYSARYSGYGEGAIQVENDGSAAAPFVVEFNGAIADPVIVLLVDGVETARMEITGEALAGESICVSTVDGNLYCYVKSGDTKTNLISGLDINNNNFFKLPIGVSELRFSAAAQITQPILLTINKLYRAV